MICVTKACIHKYSILFLVTFLVVEPSKGNPLLHLSGVSRGIVLGVDISLD